MSWSSSWWGRQEHGAAASVRDRVYVYTYYTYMICAHTHTHTHTLARARHRYRHRTSPATPLPLRHQGATGSTHTARPPAHFRSQRRCRRWQASTRGKHRGGKRFTSPTMASAKFRGVWCWSHARSLANAACRSRKLSRETLASHARRADCAALDLPMVLRAEGVLLAPFITSRAGSPAHMRDARFMRSPCPL